MLTMQHRAIAVASVEGSTWSWELKLTTTVCSVGIWTVRNESTGLYADQAESAVRRFVDDALRGELTITYPTERIGPRSESGSAVTSAAVG